MALSTAEIATMGLGSAHVANTFVAIQLGLRAARPNVTLLADRPTMPIT